MAREVITITDSVNSTVISITGKRGPQGIQGAAGVVAATAPATYDSGTQTVGVTVGTTANTLAAGDDGRITGAAQKASNLTDLTDAAAARLALGLGSAAQSATSAFDAAGSASTAQTAAQSYAAALVDDLSGVADAETARANLGAVGDDDPRLTDARTPTAHTHTAESPQFQVPIGGFRQAYAGFSSSELSVMVGIQGYQFYWPIEIPGFTTISELRFRVGSAAAAGALWRYGWHQTLSSGMPGGLVHDFGTVDPTVIGVKAFTGLSVNVPTGIFWQSLTLQGSGAGGGSYFIGKPRHALPIITTSADTVVSVAHFTTGVTGALANPAPTSLSSSGSRYPPQIEVKRSA